MKPLKPNLTRIVTPWNTVPIVASPWTTKYSAPWKVSLKKWWERNG